MFQNDMTHHEFVRWAYFDLYLENNLRALLDRLAFRWVHPRNIKENPNTVSWRYDPYLEAARDDKTRLGRSILENGTYWPLVLTDGGYVSEGCHRVHSARLLDERGEWPRERRLLSIIYPEELTRAYQKWDRDAVAPEIARYCFEEVSL
jgi:hypothetical protein